MKALVSLRRAQPTPLGPARPARRVGGVWRLFQLWRLYGALDVAWLLRDVGSSCATIFSDVVSMVASMTAMLLLAERFDGLGPWSRVQVYFLLGYGVLVQSLLETLFGYNILFISRRIGRGQLDHVLVQPQPLWLTLITEGFSPVVGLPLLIPGLAAVVWSLNHLPVVVTPLWLLLFGLNVVGSAVIVLSFSYVVGCLAFWAPHAAEEINSSTWGLLTNLRSFPLDGLSLAFLGGLLSLVPVGFVAWFPARALLGLSQHWWTLLVTPLAALMFGAVALWVFRKGMTHYVRNGSQRYLAYGHRR